jgi:hypothetical protein
MARLPYSLSIAVWITGSIWLVAIHAHVFDARRELVYAAFSVGLLTGVGEWLALRRANH